MEKIFSDLGKEKAIDIRANLEGFEESPGYQIFRKYFEDRINKIKRDIMPITKDDFNTLNRFNRNLHMAEAFDEVLRWAQDAKAQCDRVVKGES